MEKQYLENTEVEQRVFSPQRWQILQEILAKAAIVMDKLRADTLHERGYDCLEKLPAEVTTRTYEVYHFIYGAQPAVNKRQEGFSTRETIALLYARSFPRHEWNVRFSEALADKEVTNR